MRYTAKKIATMLLTMVIVSFLTFVAFSLLSGDAATRLLAWNKLCAANADAPARYGGDSRAA